MVVNLSNNSQDSETVFRLQSQLGSLLQVPVSSFRLSFPMIWFLYKKVVRSIDPPTDRILPSFLPPFDPLKALELIKLMQKYSLVVVVECPFEKRTTTIRARDKRVIT